MCDVVLSAELRESYEREIVAVEAREQSELEPRLQKNTGGRPVRMYSVTGRFHV
jgi:hypothetical protein